MTTWDEVALRSAIGLVELAAAQRDSRGGDVAAVDVEVAVTARAAVLAGAAVVLRDLVPAARHRTARGRRDLLALTERHPVRALGVFLQDRGRPRVSQKPERPSRCRRTRKRIYAAVGRGREGRPRRRPDLVRPPAPARR